MAVLSHLALLAVWYLFVKFGDVPKFVMPSPADTAATLFGPRAGEAGGGQAGGEDEAVEQRHVVSWGSPVCRSRRSLATAFASAGEQ